MKTEGLKLYFGTCLTLFFIIGCAFTFSSDLKNALLQLETSESISGITYKVQVGAYRSQIEQYAFTLEQVGEKYVLTHGSFDNYQKALKAKDSLKLAGFKDAWIPIYLHDNRSELSHIAAYLSHLEQLSPLDTSTLLVEVAPIIETEQSIPINSTFDLQSSSLGGFIAPLFPSGNDSYLKKLIFMQGEKPYYSFFLYAIIIFVGLTLSLIVVLISHRNYVKNAKAKKNITQRQINVFLSELVLEEHLSGELLDKKLADFRAQIPYRKAWCKELLIKNIIDLKKNFKGDMASMFISIYLKLDLLPYTENLIKNEVWYEKTKGIFHIEELDYVEGLPLITPFIDHRNKTLKSAALIAYISLKEQDPLDIFNGFMGHIDQVDELKILDTIKKKKIKVPSNIQEWLHSENPSLVLLTIKMISYFNHLEAGPELLNLLNCPHAEIRRNVIISCRQLFLTGAESLLLTLFERENVPNQIEIIKTLAIIGSSETEDFLGQLVELSENREVKIETMKALKEMNSVIYHSTFNHNPDLQLVKLHVEDPYIL